MDEASWKKNPPLLLNIQHAWDKNGDGEKKCLLLSSTSLSERQGGQLTFMETLFLDCSLAGVHYRSACRWNILCKMSAYVNEESAPHLCFAKSCCNLSFQLMFVTCCCPPSSLNKSFSSNWRSKRGRNKWQGRIYVVFIETDHWRQPPLNKYSNFIYLFFMILSCFVVPKLADCLPETETAKKQQIINFPAVSTTPPKGHIKSHPTTSIP